MSHYIALDWGSTNLRAWYYRDGVSVGSRRSESGVTRVNGCSHQQVFDDITQGWPVDAVPVVMAGMVGSNAGLEGCSLSSLPAGAGFTCDAADCRRRKPVDRAGIKRQPPRQSQRNA